MGKYCHSWEFAGGGGGLVVGCGGLVAGGGTVCGVCGAPPPHPVQIGWKVGQLEDFQTLLGGGTGGGWPYNSLSICLK